MKKLTLVIIVISLLFVSCRKVIKQALNIPNDENIGANTTDNTEPQKNDTISINVDDKVYKEVSVNGETFSKWLVVSGISEYDNKGNLIHYKGNKIVYGQDAAFSNVINNYEEWYEYDSNGNETHYKDSRGFERLTEYDNKGNKSSHYKNSAGQEEWYDSNGNMIYEKTIDGDEMWYEYDSKGNKT
ncbi:MAG: hypothetical protein J6P07_08725, partial [Spirochaetaceae bacterium]|nr:hypothetical protein [Spirochaetaceae bacterium]